MTMLMPLATVEFHSQSGDKELDLAIETFLKEAIRSSPSHLPIQSCDLVVGDKIYVYVEGRDHIVIVEVTNRHLVVSKEKPTVLIFVEPVNEPMEEDG